MSRRFPNPIVNVFALIAWMVCCAAVAVVPQKLGYQGRLTDASAQPITATVSMTFRLYDAATNGNLVFEETQSVSVSQGFFSVVIGSVNALNVSFNVPYFLGVSVAGEPELIPRQPVTASAYALRAVSSEALAATATVGGAQITGAITSATLTAANLTGALGTTQIANNAVTQPKLSPVAGAGAGKVLGTDGTNLQWQTPATGTVTSVGAGTGLTGGPITTSGTLSVANGGVGTAQLAGGAVDQSKLNTASVDGRYYKNFGNSFNTFALVGTNDNFPLMLMANAVYGLQIWPNGESPNLIGGHGGNSIGAGVAGAAIGGGGRSPVAGNDNTGFNQVLGSYGTIAGGTNNTAGDANTPFATIAGGSHNRAKGLGSTIGGGTNNQANFISSTVGGGSSNTATQLAATVSGGSQNSATDVYATVSGGNSNSATGFYATVPGGLANQAAGDYSFAAGKSAKALNVGCFMWHDTSSVNFVDCITLNQFVAVATGGFWFTTGTDGWRCNIGGGSGNSWTCTSDANLKTDLERLDGTATLRKLAALPVYRWRAKGDARRIPHAGPTAQDFKAAFGLGDDDKSIGFFDAQGVALSAIQGLHAELSRRDATIAELRQRLDNLTSLVERLIR
jgi:hypothetical protein